MRKLTTVSEWFRECPICKDTIYYSTKYKKDEAEIRQSVCGKCKYIKTSKSLSGKRLSDTHKSSLRRGWIKRKNKGLDHPMLGKRHTEETKRKMKKNHSRWWVGKHHTENTRKKISDSMKVYSSKYWKKAVNAAKVFNTGKKLFDNHKTKISLSNIGRKTSDCTKDKIRLKLSGIRRSETTKEKLRKIRFQQLDELGICPMYNPKACEFMDVFGDKYGYKFQHAMNGGETRLSGYSVDGYDKEKGIVFEYDEPKHETISYKRKDVMRTKRISDFNDCKMLRYSEKYNAIYWSYTDRSEIFIKT